MTLENFTTYTEVDSGNDRIQKTANHVDFKAYRNEETYLYKDKDVNHFGDFTHLINLLPVTKGSTSYAWGIFWQLSNELDDWLGLVANKKLAIMISCTNNGTTPYIAMGESYDGTGFYSSAINLAYGTQYYCTISKSGTIFTFRIYTDAARTQEVSGSPKTLTLHADHKFRYIFASNTYNDNTNTNKWIDIDIDNLDLQEVGGVPYYKTITEYIGAVESEGRIRGYVRTFTDYIGGLESASRIRNYVRSFTDTIGALDTRSRIVKRYRIFTEKIGALDSKLNQMSHRFVRVITEFIGSKDSILHTWVRPPIQWVRTVVEYIGVKDKQYRLWNWFRRLFKYKDKEHPRQKVSRT